MQFLNIVLFPFSWCASCTLLMVSADKSRDWYVCFLIIIMWLSSNFSSHDSAMRRWRKLSFLFLTPLRNSRTKEPSLISYPLCFISLLSLDFTPSLHLASGNLPAWSTDLDLCFIWDLQTYRSVKQFLEKHFLWAINLETLGAIGKDQH